MKAPSRRVLAAAMIVAPLVSAVGFWVALRSSNGGVGTTIAAYDLRTGFVEAGTRQFERDAPELLTEKHSQP